MSATHYKFVPVTENIKTGPISTVYADRHSCPPSCPLQAKECYANLGPSGWQWNKVTRGEGTCDFPQLKRHLQAVYPNRLVRYGVAGEWPGNTKLEKLNKRELNELAAATKHVRMFGYTHFPTTPHNVEAVTEGRNRGLAINWSADNCDALDEKAQHGDCVVVLEHDVRRNFTTKGGTPVKICPNSLGNPVQCIDCGLCAKMGRRYAIGFPATGAQKKHFKDPSYANRKP